MHASEGSGILIATGDPALEVPASFTRFALPFTWALTDDAPVRRTHVYRSAPIARLDERRRYFTPETASALFDRATWYELMPEGAPSETREHSDAPASCGEQFVLNIGRRKVRIAVAPPRIVLFESISPHTAAEIAKTGFLLLDVHFLPSQEDESAPTLDDLMIVNELFRYWRSPYPEHAKDKRFIADDEPYCYESVMKDVSACGDGYLTRWDDLLKHPVQTKHGMRRLVASVAHDEAAAWVKEAKGRRGWIASTDERAFVWTCALTPNGAFNLTGVWQDHDPTLEGDWVRLLNVDRPSRDEATEFERDWVRERTYERWKHVGTLYGFNIHSGAMLGAPCLKPPVWRHFSELYFDQVLLLLYLRVSLFRFSEELAKISEDIATPTKKDYENFRDLRRVFVFVTNLYRFPLLSSQQQGIEMYTMARKWLDIDDLFEEVQAEIETTHEMFELISTTKMADVTSYLTYIALPVGVLATLLAFLAADGLAKPVLRCLDRLPWLMPSWWLIVFAVPVILILLVPALMRHRR